MKTNLRKKSRLQLLHQYYIYTGFYDFLSRLIKKSLVIIFIVVSAIIITNEFIISINDALQLLTDTFSRTGILIVFFISETLFGLIPPEIFTAWSKKTSAPIINLSILATLSYIAGIVAYYIGHSSQKIATFKNYIERKMEGHIKRTRKWGGLIILTGALLPIPFSMACLAAGMIRYSIVGVILFGLFRFVRFYVYASAVYQVVT